MLTRRTLFKILAAPFALPLAKLLPAKECTVPPIGAPCDCVAGFAPVSYTIEISGMPKYLSDYQCWKMEPVAVVKQFYQQIS